MTTIAELQKQADEISVQINQLDSVRQVLVENLLDLQEQLLFSKKISHDSKAKEKFKKLFNDLDKNPPPNPPNPSNPNSEK